MSYARWVSCEVGLMRGGSCKVGYARWVSCEVGLMQGRLCEVDYVRWVTQGGLREVGFTRSELHEVGLT